MDFEDLKDQIRNCQMCRELFGFSPRPVVFGNLNAKIFQISQAPSANVHATGKPFDDQSGKKLKHEWYKIDDEVFYDEENFYITALSHCFPGKTTNGGDRLPPKACYEKWLKLEIELVKCNLYVIIGARAAKVLFPDEKFDDLVFRDRSINGRKAVVLPHPSPLNVRWLKSHPGFFEKRLPEIRESVKAALLE